MRKTIIPLILLFALQLSAGQTNSTAGPDMPYMPKINTVYFKLGERVIQVKTFQYGNVKDMVYINLHDDEITAVNGARKILEKKGGLLIKIENFRTRNINFRLDGKQYTIDPNRMFSRPGIARSLIIFGNTSPKAIDEVEKFANLILQLIPPNPSCLIALHNNTNGKYSINSYRRGGDKENDAKNLNVNNDLDADDFFLTTDSAFFGELSRENYNIILQDNINAKKDGSLSIYCGERNIHYVNCETEHGRQPEYDQMIAVAVNKVAGKNSETITTIVRPDAKKTEPIATTSKPDIKKSESTATINKPGTKKPETVAAISKPDKKKPETTPKKINNKNTGPNKTTATAVNKPNPDIISYSYRITHATDQFSLKANTEIFFGEKKVGWIRSVLADSSKAIRGRFEMDKSFALYSNMDFFLFVSGSAPPRLELRIDPTRKKELINPQSTTIPISIRVIN